MTKNALKTGQKFFLFFKKSFFRKLSKQVWWSGHQSFNHLLGTIDRFWSEISSKHQKRSIQYFKYKKVKGHRVQAWTILAWKAFSHKIEKVKKSHIITGEKWWCFWFLYCMEYLKNEIKFNGFEKPISRDSCN